MGELYLIFVGTIIVNIMAVALLFVKNGKFVSNNMFIYLMAIYTFSLGVTQYTSVPSNYIFGKLLGVLFIILSVMSMIFNRKKFLLSRILLSILLIVVSIFKLKLICTLLISIVTSSKSSNCTIISCPSNIFTFSFN